MEGSIGSIIIPVIPYFWETIMKLKSLLAAMLVAGLWTAGNAAAVSILTLDNSGSNPVQQSLDNPCIFGGSDCGSTQPAGWTFTDINPHDNDNVVTFLESSSSYNYNQIYNLVGSDFSVGIDTNQSGNQTTVTNGIALEGFRMYVNQGAGEVLWAEYVGSSTNWINLNQGTGWTDAILSGFSLAGVSNTATITFQGHYSNATNGTESFFLISNPIPEPETYAMLLAGLGLMGWVARRRKLQAA